KYFASVFQKCVVVIAYPASTEGRIAIVTDVGRGMRWTQDSGRNPLRDERCPCGRRSRVILAPQGWRQVCGLRIRKRRRQQRLVSGKSAEETVKTVAQGMPVMRLYLW